MKKRIITGVISAAIFIPFLIFSHTHAFTGAIVFLALVADFEMLKCIGLHRNIPVSAVTYLYTGAAVILSRIFETPTFLTYFSFSTLVLMMLLMSVVLFSHGKVQLDLVAETFMMIFYISISFSCVLLARDAEKGGYIFMLIFISAWFSDMGAYFTGMKFGKHKLIPDVSPKKTVEGAIGGILICVATMILYALGTQLFGKQSPKYLVFLLGGIVLSVSSMIGDLFASLLKRRHGIKDYGFIFPGHGGVLDRFDSVLATAPMVVIILTLFGFYK